MQFSWSQSARHGYGWWDSRSKTFFLGRKFQGTGWFQNNTWGFTLDIWEIVSGVATFHIHYIQLHASVQHAHGWFWKINILQIVNEKFHVAFWQPSAASGLCGFNSFSGSDQCVWIPSKFGGPEYALPKWLVVWVLLVWIYWYVISNVDPYPSIDILWMVAKSCTTKRMVETHRK